jgi:hypothetical protein
MAYMSEESERLARVEEMEDWARAWWDFDAEGLDASSPVRAGLIRSKRNVLEFCEEEAYLLPSRILYRRMALLDEMVVRWVFNSISQKDRDRIVAEAKASAKNPGKPCWGEKSRLIHDMYGIPRF